MASVGQKELYDKNAAMYILSSLMRNTEIIHDDKYAFIYTDFCTPLHQMIFGAIFNMAQEGATKLSPQDIDINIKQFDAQYTYYKNNKGFEFVQECYKMTEGTDSSQFDSYYNRVKKFAVLRDLESAGIDTTRFYNPEDILNLDEQEKKLNALQLEDIFAELNKRIVGIQDTHAGKDMGVSQDIGRGLEELVEELEQFPECGYPMDGIYINAATRGARLGKLYIYSAPSGAGKTRFMVGNACKLSMPYLNEKEEVVYQTDDEGNLDYKKILFIATEMSVDEIQTLVLANVSGVNEEHIILGNATLDEKRRLKKALKIIKKFSNNFIVECIPDPSIALIKTRLIHFIYKEDIQYIFYDYIFNSPGLVGEFQSSNLREDVVLMMLSNSLKEIAMTNMVFIQSATQLNEGWSKKEIGIRDQNCIRGSKAIADKIDIGMIGVRMTDEEYKQIDAIWQEILKYHDEWKWLTRPNIVIDIYKNRRGKINNVKIFRYFDYGTCRAIDLFITDSSYRAFDDISFINFGKVEKKDFLDFKVDGGTLE